MGWPEGPPCPECGREMERHVMYTEAWTGWICWRCLRMVADPGDGSRRGGGLLGITGESPGGQPWGAAP